MHMKIDVWKKCSDANHWFLRFLSQISWKKDGHEDETIEIDDSDEECENNDYFFNLFCSDSDESRFSGFEWIK